MSRLDDALGRLEHAVWSWWRRRSAPVQGLLLALALLLVFVIQAIRG